MFNALNRVFTRIAALVAIAVGALLTDQVATLKRQVEQFVARVAA